MRRALTLIVIVVGAAVLGAAAPSHAIETNTFGMEPDPSGSRTSFRIEVRPGATTTQRLRVWNKTEAPLTLKLTAIGASVDSSGKVALGGGGSGVAAWFSFEPEQVQLAPTASQVVGFDVRSPSSLEAGDLAAAVTVEPVATGSGGVAVVQRLATMVYIKTVAGTAGGGIGWKLPALILLSVISIAGAVLAWTRPRERATEEEEFEAAPSDEEEEVMLNEAPDDQVEVGGIYVSVNDPAVDQLYEAMYEPTPRRVGQPQLQLVSQPAAEPPASVEPNEEFAWTALRKR